MERPWPLLSYHDGKETYETIHMWTQIVGKVKLALLPWLNHAWHITLHISPTGLSTLLIPYIEKDFQIDFNFVDHSLQITTSKGEAKEFSLLNISVASFYQKLFDCLRQLNIMVQIRPIPSEIQKPIPFMEDTIHATYEPGMASAFHQALLCVNDVFIRFRGEFKGKASPIHFFWGSFDLAYSRFCGRPAPMHPGGVPNLPDWVAREAYSDEVNSCGFWTGSEALPEAAFYAYIYPEPAGFKDSIVVPEAAYYHKDLHEFILPYEAVRSSDSPATMLLDFLHSTYHNCASLAEWDIKALETTKHVDQKSLL